MDGAGVVDRDAAGGADAGPGGGEVDVGRLGVDRPAERAVRMVLVDGALVAARHAEQRAVLDGAVVHHHADGGEIVIGVRVEGPVLVPLHGAP